MKGGSPGINIGLAGKLILIVVAVTAAIGGFSLGYFVGKNGAPPAHQVSQQASQPAPGADIATPVVEARPAQAVIPSTDQTPPPASGREGSRGEQGGPHTGQPVVQDVGSGGATQEASVQNAPTETKPVQQGPVREKEAAAGAGTPKTAVSEEGKTGETVYTVQVGAFKSRKEADALKSRLEGKGYKAQRRKAALKGKVVFKIMVGEFHQEKEAKVLAMKLKKTEGLKAFVTKKDS